MKEFIINKKVYYHDTDSEGVVYYANYLKYFEEARTEHLLSKGIELGNLSKEGLLFAVSAVEIKYKGPARLADKLVVSSRIGKIKRGSLEYIHQVRRDDQILVECRTTLVAIGRKFKPVKIPEEISSRLSGEG